MSSSSCFNHPDVLPRTGTHTALCPGLPCSKNSMPGDQETPALHQTTELQSCMGSWRWVLCQRGHSASPELTLSAYGPHPHPKAHPKRAPWNQDVPGLPSPALRAGGRGLGLHSQRPNGWLSQTVDWTPQTQRPGSYSVSSLNELECSLWTDSFAD